MREHLPTLALLGALIMILITIIVLTLLGVKMETMGALGLGTAIGTIVGVIGGISPPPNGGTK